MRGLLPNCIAKRIFSLQKSNEESTDLSSQDKNHSTGEKRNSDAVTEEVEPAAKKLKTCEDQAPSEETTSESPVPPAPKPEDTQTQSAPAANPAPQVAVWEVEKKSKEKWHLHHQHSAEKHTKRKDPVKAHRLYYRHLKQY